MDPQSKDANKMSNTAVLNDKNSKTYFRLFPDVIHAMGASSHGALYLLVERKIIKLGTLANSVLRNTEQNNDIKETTRRTQVPFETVISLLKDFESRGAGFFSNSPYFVETVRQPDVMSDMILYAKPPVVERFRISLSANCENSCPFCSRDEPNRTLIPCFGCSRGKNEEGKELSVAWIRKALEEVRFLGCDHVTFTAGDFSSVEQLLREAIAVAKKREFKFIECFSGSAIPNHLIHHLVEKGVAPTLQIFSTNPKTHDKIFGRSGAFSEVMDNICYLKDQNAPYSLYYVYANKSDSPLETIDELYAHGPAMVYFNRALNVKDSFSDHLYGENNLVPPDINVYANWLSKKHCLNSVLTLTPAGHYHFCSSQLDQNSGHVAEKTIQQIFVEIDSGDTSWDPIIENKTCAECEYNVACHVCKATDLQVRPNDRHCGYDLHSGIWRS